MWLLLVAILCFVLVILARGFLGYVQMRRAATNLDVDRMINCIERLCRLGVHNEVLVFENDEDSTQFVQFRKYAIGPSEVGVDMVCPIFSDHEKKGALVTKIATSFDAPFKQVPAHNRSNSFLHVQVSSGRDIRFQLVKALCDSQGVPNSVTRSAIPGTTFNLLRTKLPANDEFMKAGNPGRFDLPEEA